MFESKYKSNWVMVDIEADGPAPGLYSMVTVGAVVVEDGLNRKFYAKIKPISENWIAGALAVSGFTREETMEFGPGEIEIPRLNDWVKELGIDKPRFISDNNGFDWQFVNYYLWKFVNDNPFGHSSTNLGSFYKGILRDFRKHFKFLREGRHTHNALEDAVGNAQAMLKILEKYNVKG